MRSVDPDKLLDRVASGTEHTVLVLPLGFEERCLRFAESLSNRSPDLSKLDVIAIDLPNANVAPSVIQKRTELRDRLRGMFSPQFLSVSEALNAVTQVARKRLDHGRPRILIDASSVPRLTLLKILESLSRSRPTFERCDFLFTHPAEYAEYDGDIPSSPVPIFYDSPLPRSAELRTIVIFAGFNVAESTAVLASTLPPSCTKDDTKLIWVFTHPGARYSFYERAVIAQSPLMESLQIRQEERLCRLDDLQHAASIIVECSHALRRNECMFVAPLGPRVHTAPIYLSVAALRDQHGIDVNIVVPSPLQHRTIRSEGSDPRTRVWRLRQLSQFVDQSIPKTDKQSRLWANEL